MGIDYAGLYARDYFGHEAGARSFQVEFPGSLADVARSLGCGGVLDVGSGNGELTRQLQALGLRAVPLDLRGDEAAGVLPMDLTAMDSGQVDRVRSGSSPRLAGSPHLATCLDVLEHIDRSNLPAALWNLRELTSEWLLVSVSTRPSSRDNLYHATVAPRRTWKRLFEAAGFEVEEHAGLSAMPSVLEYRQEEPFWCLNQWRRLDPFGDTRGPEPYYLLLRKQPGAIDAATLEARAEAILDLTPASAGGRPALHPETHLTFLVGHYQDFHHYRPFWDAIDRSAVTVLIRAGALRNIDPRRYRAILAYLKSHGLAYREVESVREVDWSAAPGSRRALVVATESTVIDTHLLNASFVLAAQGAGYRTFQIQHGIWPHADFSVPVVFTSEHVLTWSDEFRDGFAGHALEPGATSRPGDPTRFTRTGCPKFDGNADPRPIRPADLLGDWAEGYAQAVLLATNLQWSMHERGPEVVPALIALAERNPDTLFLCKLHPVHDVDGPLLGELPANFQVLDEFVCLFADLTTPRLIRACDAVITTPSTVALEAGLAGRPFAVIDTGNPNRFVGVEPVPIEGLEAELQRLLDPSTRAELLAQHECFVDHYYDRSLLGHGLTRVIEQIEADLSNRSTEPATPTTAEIVARAFSASLANNFLLRGRERLAELAGQIADRDRQIAHHQAEARSFQAEVESLRAEIHRLDERHRADLAATQGECQSIEQELVTTRIRLDAAHDRLAPVSDLGPATIKLARGLRRIADRHPQVAHTVKTVARTGMRLWKR